MQGKEILRLVSTLHRSKEIDEEVIFQAIESALESAAQKHFADEEITVEINRETGEMAAIRGEERITPEMLGRIAAQSAKQIIIQKIREAESETVFNEYEHQVGTLLTGAVQRFEGGAIIVNLGKTEAILPRSEQIPGEHYQAGERVRAILLDVRKVNNLVRIMLSRASPDIIQRLFELEVPEVAEGVVKIERIAREPGLRTKVAVISLDSRVDCIGACVGVRGTRIKSIIDEVKGEKIDIIPWHDDPATLIADSLRPAEILQITLEEGETTKRAIVTVPEDQLSLAIGWKGQNVRLAVKMSGWDIDIEPPEPEPGDEDEAEPEAAEGPAAETESAEEPAAEPEYDEAEPEAQAELASAEEPAAETEDGETVATAAQAAPTDDGPSEADPDAIGSEPAEAEAPADAVLEAAEGQDPAEN